MPSLDSSVPAKQARRCQFLADCSPPSAEYRHPILAVLSLLALTILMMPTHSTMPTLVQNIHHNGPDASHTKTCVDTHTQTRITVASVNMSNATDSDASIDAARLAASETEVNASCTTKIALVSVVPSFRKGAYSHIIADLHLAQMEQLMASDRCLHRHEVVQCSPEAVNGARLSSLVAKLLHDSDVVVVVDSSVVFHGATAVLELVQKHASAWVEKPSSVQVFQQGHVSGVAVAGRFFGQEAGSEASNDLDISPRPMAIAD